MAFHEYSKQSGSGLPLKIQLFRGYNKARQWVTESGEDGYRLGHEVRVHYRSVRESNSDKVFGEGECASLD